MLKEGVEDMKIAVFGATGGTGLPLVEQALEAGHEVVVLVRTPSKMKIKHERLKVIQGDVMHRADVEKVITADIDAVVSVLAPSKDGPKEVLPVGAQHIIDVMKANGVDRLIYMTGAGVEMPGDRPKLMNHIIRFMLKTMAGDVLEKSERAVEKVKASDLDWTILRAPMLTNAPHSGSYRVGMVGVNTGPRLARADAADFILKSLSGGYSHEAPVVSN
jgi:putative NADH-flavin reductase